MKTAISTLACAGWTLEKSLQVCKEYNIQALEIRMGLHLWSDLSLTDAEYLGIYDKIVQAGMIVSDLGTSVVVCGDDDAALVEIERCAQIARLFGCTGLRIMLGNFYNRRSEPRKPIHYAGILSWLRKADAIMQQYNTQIWVETHNEFATGKALRKLLQDTGAKNIKLVWDIMHPLEARESLQESYNFMQPDIAHVHIKDGKPWSDTDMENYCYTPIGKGCVDIGSAVRILQSGGYSGYYSLEWEGVWRKEIQGPDFPPEQAIADFSNLMKQW